MGALTRHAAALRLIPPARRFGSVAAVRGALIEVDGLLGAARLGAHLVVATDAGPLDAEVTALSRGSALCLPFAEPRGLATGQRAELAGEQLALRPGPGWLGRVVDGLGRPIDGKGPLPAGPQARAVRSEPPPAALRARVGGKLATGIAALDIFAPLCRGQRLGLFAGSGIGKSTLLAKLAPGCGSDVAVIGLIGERGRELQDFLTDTLGADGLARSVVVVATSDAPALLRRQAAWTTLAIAEQFRDDGAEVLCLMDSVTRFAMAQREIGLANGEPPASKGYTPSVFAELPRLLERAGPGLPGSGSITAIFTVLVDGDDHDEPVADAVRGILDGHVVMSRRIAERGRYPAIDVLKSVSRTLPHCHSAEQNALRLEAAELLSRYAEVEELVRLGAYRSGTDAATDRAIALAPQIEALLGQSGAAEPFAELGRVLADPEGGAG